jgi:hypothetical protein
VGTRKGGRELGGWGKGETGERGKGEEGAGVCDRERGRKGRISSNSHKSDASAELAGPRHGERDFYAADGATARRVG